MSLARKVPSVVILEVLLACAVMLASARVDSRAEEALRVGFATVDFCVPTRKAFSEGSYEVVNSPVRPGGGKLLLEAALRLLTRLASLENPSTSGIHTVALSPDQGLSSLQTEAGLRVELVAAEPDVVDPVAMAFDEGGRLYVVEGRGYPLAEGRGVVALLEDPDGDGRFSRRSDFATGLRFPNGILPWKGGVFVTDAPDVLYLKDENRDGLADRREVVLTGFATDRSTQLRVNDPTVGLDGWIYLAGGLSGGKVTSPRNPVHPAVDLKRMDLRFHPGTGAFEATDGKSQFGIAFDDFGRRFLCMNRVQAQHVVIESRYLLRNQGLAFSDTVEDLPEERIDDFLRGHNAAARIYPISDNITTADSHAGTFSAACAVTVWRGGALPDSYTGQVFSCDPTGNLVHRDRLLAEGATFVARRPPEHREFLASPDNWFRPVFLSGGPDGALYVCDMYRLTIEHPDYLPTEVRKRADFSGGKNRGRIYRVLSDSRPSNGSTAVDRAGDAELAVLLENQNSWTRDAAFRLLVERADKRSAAAVRGVLSRGRSAAGESMALHLLAQLGSLEDDDLVSALRSARPRICEVALRLAESRLRDNRVLRELALHLGASPDPRLLFQCALALGQVPFTERVKSVIVAIAVQDADDRWARAAVISSIAGHELDVVSALLETRPTKPGTGFFTLVRDLSRASAARGNSGGIQRFLAETLRMDPDESSPGVLAVLNGLARGGIDLEAAAGEEKDRLADLADRAVLLSLNRGRPLEERSRAVEFLGHARSRSHIDTLARLIGSDEPNSLEIAAVRALGRMGRGMAASTITVERLQQCAIPVRESLIEEFVGSADFAEKLIQALEEGSLALTTLSVDVRGKLLKHAEPRIRSRAREILASADGDRRKVYEAFKRAAALPGNPTKGRALFRAQCASCHRLDREGTNVGPDLFGIRNQPKETILLHVLVPNREITPGFESHTLVTERGEVLTGLVRSETPSSVTLLQKGGGTRALLRDEIVSMDVSSVSLMPDGLELATDVQGMADLLAYLKGEG